MSVEGAFARYDDLVICIYDVGGAGKAGDTALQTERERLILEVQAAMPCYEVWSGIFPPHDDCLSDGRNPCPSCAARTKLAEQKVPA